MNKDLTPSAQEVEPLAGLGEASPLNLSLEDDEALLEKFTELQAARRALKFAHDALVAAHLKLQSNGRTAYEMADGDVRSICGLPHPNVNLSAYKPKESPRA